ncbi:hypothetical protein D3C71_1870980 [compost metagenome]
MFLTWLIRLFRHVFVTPRSPEASIAALAGQQLGMVALFADRAVLKHNDMIGVHDGI